MSQRTFLTLKEIHREETSMLAKVAEFCDTNHIKYYICGGTLLGAIRHHGFIPWDDDVDLMMPRSDFERFEKMGREKTIGPALGIISKDNGTMRYPFCKVINYKLKVDKSTRSDDSQRYLWIDVFPMDGLPVGNRDTERLYQQVKRSRSIAMGLLVQDEFLRSFTDNKKKLYMKFAIRKLIRGKWKNKLIDDNFERLDRLSKTYNYDCSKYVGGVVWGYGPQEKMKKSHIQDRSVEFEGLHVNGLSNYDEYLTNLYGDYMTLPPVEKRVCHKIKVFRV